jgi:hypothetical protein
MAAVLATRTLLRMRVMPPALLGKLPHSFGQGVLRSCFHAIIAKDLGGSAIFVGFGVDVKGCGYGS